MNKRYWIFLLLVVALAVGASYLIFSSRHHQDQAAVENQMYTCPMHPQIVRDAPGDCPICGMKLVPIKKDEPAKDRPGKTMYRSSMNPSEISDKPGKDSMGMDMIPIETDGEETNTPSGLASITVSKEKQELIGLTFGTVTMKNISKEIRTSARIAPDETRLYRITIKVEGWMERLFVNQTGQYVKKGDPLLAVYSPDLVAAQQEYLTSVAALKNLAASSDSTDSGNMKGIESSAREKLRLFDISDARIDGLRASGKVERTMTIESPVPGYVTDKMVLQGQRVMMNDPLMTIADLSRVWGEADIYESDLPYVKTGMPAELTLSYWPEKNFKGRIGFLNPFLDPETRTAKARIEIPNPEYVLKPGMYADVKLSYDLGERLVVPESAVMRTGVRDYAFVEGENDRIIPREIKLGAYSGDGDYEVISELNDGERVVTSANFLIDSESSLKSALQSAAAETHQK